MTTTSKTATRIMDTDPKTGRRFVRTTTVEGAATVTVTKFVGVMTGDKYSWSSATYDVTSAAGEVHAGAVRWNGKGFMVGSRSAPTLARAVRAVLGIEPLPAPKAKAKAKAKAKPKPKAAANVADVSGGSVIEKDPGTGLPRIRPEVQAKADAIVADQLAAKRAAKDAG